MDQYSQTDSLNVVAAALLGFEAVLVTLLKGRVDDVCLGISIGLLIASMIVLFFCLLDRTGFATWPPQKWSFATKEAERLDIALLSTLYAGQNAVQTAGVLVATEHDLYERNKAQVHVFKRRTIDIAVYLLAAALFTYGVGAVIGNEAAHAHVEQPKQPTQTVGPCSQEGCRPSGTPSTLASTPKNPQQRESVEGRPGTQAATSPKAGLK
ncbi:hypothetical protein ACFWSF_32145 [Streptomyces sp. NPDC058611]|uniref:hypothetical protein n=1 Tax=unclassified Streptomyces TaxID=2593676 RepID=UPI003662131D